MKHNYKYFRMKTKLNAEQQMNVKTKKIKTKKLKGRFTSIMLNSTNWYFNYLDNI